MSDVFAEIMKVPPVTRFLVGSSLAVTVPTLLHLVSPYPYYFAYDLVRYKYEVRILATYLTCTELPASSGGSSLRSLLQVRFQVWSSEHGLKTSIEGGIFYLVEVVMLL